MELRGSAEDFDKGISYLEQKTGVQVEPVTLGIRRDEERCCQCGSCTVCLPDRGPQSEKVPQILRLARKSRSSSRSASSRKPSTNWGTPSAFSTAMIRHA